MAKMGPKTVSGKKIFEKGLPRCRGLPKNMFFWSIWRQNRRPAVPKTRPAVTKLPPAVDLKKSTATRRFITASRYKFTASRSFLFITNQNQIKISVVLPSRRY